MADDDFSGTIAGIASAGTKLSVSLYTFSETISTDHRNIKSLAHDISFVSSTLAQLDNAWKQNGQVKVSSVLALTSGKAAVKECETIFNELNSVLDDAKEFSSKRPSKRKLTLSAAERSEWPFLQPRADLLAVNLERVKSTLLLFLNVVTKPNDVGSE